MEGFQLVNAIWNKSALNLDEGSNYRKTTDQAIMPVLWLLRKEKAIFQKQDEIHGHFYDCPIYASKISTEQSFIGSFNLPSEIKQNLCFNRQIYLYCDLPR